jgi:hypothetical protein
MVCTDNTGDVVQDFSNITHLLSMLLVSVEKIRPIINKKFVVR